MSKKYFFGFGLGGKSFLHDEEGHVRITKTENGIVTGGTKDEHGEMQDIAIQLNEKIDEAKRKHGDKLDDRHIQDAMSEVFENR